MAQAVLALPFHVSRVPATAPVPVAEATSVIPAHVIVSEFAPGATPSVHDRVTCPSALVGPAPQALSRLRGRYRWHVLLKAASGTPLREIATALLADSERAGHGKIRIIADVDPIEVL